MAVYDSDSGKLVVRVVYDGPGLAGKTTNLQQLCTFFSRQRRSALYRGETAEERTLFLDWLQLDGGLVAGRELRCHLISVPGQVVLDRRRQLLLASADATVFVTESTEAGLEAALPSWRSMLARTGGPEGGVPAVLQANKQDEAGALTREAIRQRWQVDRSIPIVAAEASTGVGVQETVVLAIRAAAIHLQERLLHQTVESLTGHYETGEELERRMLAVEKDSPISPADIIVAARGGKSVPSGPAPKSSTERRAPPRESSIPAPIEDQTGRSGRLRGQSGPPLSAAQAKSGGSGPPPPLPSREVPSGSIWPTVEGRETLVRLPIDEATPCSPEELRENFDEEELVFEAGIWCLKTRRDRCFSSLEEAREALLQLVHLKLALGSLLAPRTVLAIQQDARGSWLWTVAPWLCTLRARLDHYRAGGNTKRLAQELAGYSQLVQRAQHLRLEHNLTLDLDPRCFGHVCGELFYLKDTTAPKESAVADSGRALLRQVELYADDPQAVAHYLETTTAWLSEHFRSKEAERPRFAEAVEAAQPSTEAGASARAQLLSAVTQKLAKAQ